MAFLPSLPLPARPRAVALQTMRPPRPLPARRRTPRMAVLEAGGVDDMDKILSAADDTLVVVDYSTSWCGPCRTFAPIFEELSEVHTDVVFVKVMGDATTATNELMAREGIRAVPAFHFWKNNEKVKTFTGARKEDFESALNALKK